MSINYAKSLRFKPYTKKITFDKNGFPLDYYSIYNASADKARWMHMQDILRLPNANGKQYYLGTYSQNCSNTTGGMVFVGELSPGTSRGKVIWADILDNHHTAGGFNHPGDIRLIDNVVVIAGQNWPGDDLPSDVKKAIMGAAATAGFLTAGPLGAIGALGAAAAFNKYYDSPNDLPRVKKLTLGNGGNAILFYDISNPARPRYMGKLDSYRKKSGSQHHIKNDIDKVQIDKRRDGYYYLYTNAIDGNRGWQLRSKTLSPNVSWEWISDPETTDSKPSIHYRDDNDHHCSAYVDIVEKGRKMAWLKYQTPDKSFRNDYVRIPKTSFGDGTTMNITTKANGANILVYGNVNSDSKIEIEEVHGIEHNQPITNLFVYEKGGNGGIPSGYQMLPLDMNESAGGEDIFLCYTRDPKAGKPIRGITVQYDHKTAPSGYTNISHNSPDDKGPYDLNRRAGGKDIYMFFSRQASAGVPIYAIDIIDEDKTTVADKKQRGWELVNADLNKGSNDSPNLYLIYTKYALTPKT